MGLFSEFEKGLLPQQGGKRRRSCRMTASEMMTILVLFHLSHYRDFKNFYLHYVHRHIGGSFHNLLSYHRFLELKSRAFPALCVFLKGKTGDETGLYYVDSTTLKVCRNQRINNHKTLNGIADRGKSSMGWFYGFKLHLAINEKGEIMTFSLIPGNVDDRRPIASLCKKLKGLIAADKGYLSAKLKKKLQEMGLTLITKHRKNMKQPKHTAFQKLFLAKRAIVEAVIEQLKEICQIEHSRHRKPDHMVPNILAALIAYTLKPRKPVFNIAKYNALIPN